jgi:hypothetical protein
MTMFLACFLSVPAFAGTVFVPNASFEMPPVEINRKNPFGALPFIDVWDETDIGPGDEMDQNTGVFRNVPPRSAGHIENAHLDRLAFISSLIGNDIRQALPVNFVPGEAYSLTVGVATSLTFPVGSSEQLEIALFYFDGGSEQIVASTFVSGSQVSSTSLVDATVNLPAVDPGDPWAGEPVGILIRPAITDPDDRTGEGFWDVDNVRLDGPAAVPAASTWGMIGMGAGVLALGAAAIRRRGASGAPC